MLATASSTSSKVQSRYRRAVSMEHIHKCPVQKWQACPILLRVSEKCERDATALIWSPCGGPFSVSTLMYVPPLLLAMGSVSFARHAFSTTQGAYPSQATLPKQQTRPAFTTMGSGPYTFHIVSHYCSTATRWHVMLLRAAVNWAVRKNNWVVPTELGAS